MTDQTKVDVKNVRKIWTSGTGIEQHLGGISQKITIATEHVYGNVPPTTGRREWWVEKSAYDALKAENERIRLKPGEIVISREKLREVLIKNRGFGEGAILNELFAEVCDE